MTREKCSSVSSSELPEQPSAVRPRTAASTGNADLPKPRDAESVAAMSVSFAAGVVGRVKDTHACTPERRYMLSMFYASIPTNYFRQLRVPREGPRPQG